MVQREGAWSDTALVVLTSPNKRTASVFRLLFVALPIFLFKVEIVFLSLFSQFLFGASPSNVFHEKRSVEDGGMKGEIKEDDSLKIEPNDGGETEITFLAIKQHENPENSTKLGSKLVSARYNPVTFRESSKKSSKTHYTEYYSNNTQRNPVQLSKTTKNR